MTRPRIILALGDAGKPPDAIVIDHRNLTIWHRGKSKRWRSRTVFGTIAALIVSQAHQFSHDDLCEAIWGDDEDGGPENIASYLGGVVSGNKLTDWLGISVRGNWQRGYSITWR